MAILNANFGHYDVTSDGGIMTCCKQGPITKAFMEGLGFIRTEINQLGDELYTHRDGPVKYLGTFGGRILEDPYGCEYDEELVVFKFPFRIEGETQAVIVWSSQPGSCNVFWAPVALFPSSIWERAHKCHEDTAFPRWESQEDFWKWIFQFHEIKLP